MEFLMFFILGGIISVLSGFFGVGGGFILTPILLLFGFSPLQAITTSLLFTIGTSASGIFAHVHLKNILWREGTILGLSGVVATQFARPFVFFLEKRGWDDIAVPLFYIALLSYFAITMFMQGKTNSRKEIKTVGSPAVIKLLSVGFLGGFVSTTLGVGGGFIMVPLSIAYLGIIPKKAVGTSLFAVLMIVTVGFISYAVTVPIDYWIGVILIVGGLIGSQFGARLTIVYENKEISFLLSMLYLATLMSVILKLANMSVPGLILLGVFIAFFFIKSILRIRMKGIAATE